MPSKLSKIIFHFPVFTFPTCFNLNMHIWIVNPFDELPNETDVPLRYWSLCRMFVELGHDVIWWSSDFSHLRKVKRKPCPDTNGFSIRLIKTPPYRKNISFARLKNHRTFATGFYDEAIAGIKGGEFKAPDRIIVSLPPLGAAESAFRIRKLVKSQLQKDCQVIVDIMDAWPETFYRVLPRSLRKMLGSVLFAPFHRSAKLSYEEADKISAVGQSYLELAKSYLASSKKSPNPSARAPIVQTSSAKPMHLCYHGTDLDRFQSLKNDKEYNKSSVNTPPLKAVYLGAMGSGYDLMTIIKVAAQWKAEGRFPWQLHFAGSGSQLEKLKVKSRQSGLMQEDQTNEVSFTVNQSSSTLHPSRSPARIVFHGSLKKEAVNELLLSADVALVPNRTDSLVACPYKVGEYAAAGLPMLSCLNGEFSELLEKWDAGSNYIENDSGSLYNAFEAYFRHSDLMEQQSSNARKMAEALFDRSRTYPLLAKFIVNSSESEISI
jgi:glycosyltransferase involved in cell wall biosynthesis